MSQQQFYPYVPPPNEQVQCELVSCGFHASWWDAFNQALWCDFHAAAIQGGASCSQCGGCFEWYPSSQVVQGVCPDCRSVMPALWSDVPSDGITILSIPSPVEVAPHWCSFCGVEREDVEQTGHCPGCWSPLQGKDEVL